VHHFAIVALLGLATWKFVGLVLGLMGQEMNSTVKAFITLAVGVIAAEILDYSVFAGWGVTFRADWMGPVFTGLVIGSMAYVWHNLLGAVEAYGRRNRDQAREIESRSPRAA
jgi:hypothetical protein